MLKLLAAVHPYRDPLPMGSQREMSLREQLDELRIELSRVVGYNEGMHQVYMRNIINLKNEFDALKRNEEPKLRSKLSSEDCIVVPSISQQRIIDQLDILGEKVCRQNETIEKLQSEMNTLKKNMECLTMLNEADKIVRAAGDNSVFHIRASYEKMKEEMKILKRCVGTTEDEYDDAQNAVSKRRRI